MYNNIVDPNTNTVYDINSNKGKKILSNYVSQVGGKKAPKRKSKRRSSRRSSRKSPVCKRFENMKKTTHKNVYAPDKYFEGLPCRAKEQRLRTIKKYRYTKENPTFATDFNKKGERIKTKLSGYTKQFKKIAPGVTSLKDISSHTGVPLRILNKVNSKGMGAWRTGHRPGANRQQWGFARVYSFLVKGKAFYTADNHLAVEAMKIPEAKKWFDSIDGLCDQDKYKDERWCS